MKQNQKKASNIERPILCENCFQFILVKIQLNNPNVIQTECPYCYEKKVKGIKPKHIQRFFLLSEFIEYKIQFPFEFCMGNKVHRNIKSICYCIKCNKSFCAECFEKHQLTKFYQNHGIIDKKYNQNLICKQDMNNSDYFCESCEEHFCRYHLHSHSTHKYINISELMTKDNYEFYRNKLLNARKFLTEDFKSIQENIINQISEHEKIEELNGLYKKNLNVNLCLLYILDILVENFFNYRPCYYTYKNLVNNFKLNVIHFPTINSKSSKTLNDYIYYLENNFIINEEFVNLNNVFLNRTIKINSQFTFLKLKDNSLIVLTGKEIKKINFLTYQLYPLIKLNQNISSVSQLNNERLALCMEKFIKIYDFPKEPTKCIGELRTKWGVKQCIELTNSRLATISPEYSYEIWSIKEHRRLHKSEVYEKIIENFLQLKCNEKIVIQTSKTIYFIDNDNYTKEKEIEISTLIPEICCIKEVNSTLIIGGNLTIIILDPKSFQVITRIHPFNDQGKDYNSFIFLRDGSILFGGGFSGLYFYNFSFPEFCLKFESSALKEKSIQGLTCSRIDYLNERYLVIQLGTFLSFWRY